MPRSPFIHVPGGIYSVVSKCNNDEFHFDSEEKFQFYLAHLLWCKQQLKFLMYDICCMSNHVHEMYVVPEHVTIAQILQKVKGLFSLRYNIRYGRTGHFWRNKSFYRLVEDEQYALNCCAYFHQNPVTAGMVRDPAEWPYSGYRFHALGDRSGLIGQLLDPIPGVSSTAYRNPDPIALSYVEAAMERQNAQFIGSHSYRAHMQKLLCTRQE